jgi:O-antigen ligase
MLTAGLVGLLPLILLAVRRPHICLALGFPSYLFMGMVSTYFPISVSAASAVFPLAAMMGSLVRGYKKSIGKCEILLLVLALLMLVSLGYSGNREYGIDKVSLFCFMCVPTVIAAPQVITNIGALRTVVRIISLSLLAYAVAGALLDPVIETLEQRASAWGLGDVTRAGQFFGLAAIVGIVHFRHRSPGSPQRFLDLGLIGISLLLLLRTGTRAAFVALVLTVGYLYWFANLDWLKGLFKRSGAWLIGVLAAVLLLLVGPTLLSPIIPEEVLSRFASIDALFSNFSRDEVVNWQDSESRTLNFFSAIEGMYSHPLQGLGAGGYIDALSLYSGRPKPGGDFIQAYPHNLLLEFGVEQGIPGFMLILLVLYRNHKTLLVLRKFVASHPNEAFLLGYVAGFFVYGLCVSMTALDIPRMMILWWGMGLLLAANRVYAAGEPSATNWERVEACPESP